MKKRTSGYVIAPTAESLGGGVSPSQAAGPFANVQHVYHVPFHIDAETGAHEWGAAELGRGTTAGSAASRQSAFSLAAP